jgi:hypothetical protein
MTVSNADRAIIAADKLTSYLLNEPHKRGAAKARLLLGVGYRFDAPHVLESDLRDQHLSLDVTRTHENAYGVVYEIVGRSGRRTAAASSFAPSGRLTLAPTCRDSLPCTRGRRGLRTVRRRDLDP